MTAAIVAVATAVTAVSGLLLYLFKTQWSAKVRWWKEYAQLQKAFRRASDLYTEVSARGHSDVEPQLREHWREMAQKLNDHRIAGQRAGYIRRTQ